MRIRSLGVGAAALAVAALAGPTPGATAGAPVTATASAVKFLSGAGSTLVAPLVAEWAQEFPVFTKWNDSRITALNPGVRLPR